MLQRIDPKKLNGKQKEIYNFQKSAALLADYGFNCIKLSDDWQGADFLAHHFDGKTTLKVQLKARLTIDRKYLGQDLWMNFPSAGTWYLVPGTPRQTGRGHRGDHQLAEHVVLAGEWIVLERQPLTQAAPATAPLRCRGCPNSRKPACHTHRKSSCGANETHQA